MRVIKTAIIAITTIIITSCGARIPTSIDAAKRKVEKNHRQIEAIIDYHGLRNPFLVRDTVVFRYPNVSGRINLDSSLSFLKGFDYSFDKFVKPALLDSAKSGTIKRIVYEYLSRDIDHTYEDSVLFIRFSGNQDSIVVDYQIKERYIDVPIEYESSNIDTEVKWYEDRFVKIAMILIIAGVFSAIIVSIIRKPQ